MSADVGFHPAARSEMREADGFYDSERPGLGAELLDAIELTMQQVMKCPEATPLVPRRIGSCEAPRFP